MVLVIVQQAVLWLVWPSANQQHAAHLHRLWTQSDI